MLCLSFFSCCFRLWSKNEKIFDILYGRFSTTVEPNTNN